MAGTDTGACATAQQPIRCRDNRVEVRAGDRPEQQDQHGQAEHRGGGVLQELQSDVIRGELLCGNTGPDDHGDQQGGAGELGEQSSGQRNWVIHGLLVRTASVPSSNESCCSASANDPVVDPRAAPLTVEQSGGAQDLQVMGDGRLAQVDPDRQLADARLATGMAGHHAQQSQPTGSDSALSLIANSAAASADSG